MLYEAWYQTLTMFNKVHGYLLSYCAQVTHYIVQQSNKTCTPYQNVVLRKNYIKFIYHFVKYNNKSSNLYEFQCYIGGHLFPVTC